MIIMILTAVKKVTACIWHRKAGSASGENKIDSYRKKQSEENIPDDHHSGYAGGLTVLMDENGKPAISPVEEDADI